MIKRLCFFFQCLHGILYYATIVLPLLAGVHMALKAVVDDEKSRKGAYR